MPAPSSTLTHDALGILAPKFADITDRVLFDDVWQRPELSARERSIVTVAALAALYRPEQLPFHLERAQTNGVSRDELADIVTSLTPKCAALADRVLFDDIWQRSELSIRERSIVTVAAMVALYQPDLLTFHLERAQSNGVSQNELAEIITHLAFYAGWPAAHSALRRLQDLPSSAKE